MHTTSQRLGWAHCLAAVLMLVACAGCADTTLIELLGSGQPAETPEPEGGPPRPGSVPRVSDTEGELHTYECANGFRFGVMAERDTARLFLPSNRRLALSRRAVPDGAKYRGESALFWRTGQRNARLRIGGTEHEGCQRTPQRDAWEAARLRGVDLYAVGESAPAWRLDVKDDRYIVFASGESEERILLPARPPDTLSRGDAPSAVGEESNATAGAPRRLVYTVETASYDLVLTVTDVLCRSAISGVRYPKRVIVELNGERYQGCGRRP